VLQGRCYIKGNFCLIGTDKDKNLKILLIKDRYRCRLDVFVVDQNVVRLQAISPVRLTQRC
jgi:hypothetical protein